MHQPAAASSRMSAARAAAPGFAICFAAFAISSIDPAAAKQRPPFLRRPVQRPGPLPPPRDQNMQDLAARLGTDPEKLLAHRKPGHLRPARRKIPRRLLK